MINGNSISVILLLYLSYSYLTWVYFRGGSRTTATSKMKRLVNGFQPLTIITKQSILDAAAVVDLPLYT